MDKELVIKNNQNLEFSVYSNKELVSRWVSTATKIQISSSFLELSTELGYLEKERLDYLRAKCQKLTKLIFGSDETQGGKEKKERLIKETKSITFVVDSTELCYPWHLLFWEDKFLFEREIRLGICRDNSKSFTNFYNPTEKICTLVSQDFENYKPKVATRLKLVKNSKKQLILEPIEIKEESLPAIRIIFSHGETDTLVFLNSNGSVESNVVDFSDEDDRNSFFRKIKLKKTEILILVACKIANSTLFSPSNIINLVGSHCAGVIASVADIPITDKYTLPEFDQIFNCLAKEIASKNNILDVLRQFYIEGINCDHIWRLGMLPLMPSNIYSDPCELFKNILCFFRENDKSISSAELLNSFKNALSQKKSSEETITIGETLCNAFKYSKNGDNPC